MASSLTSPGLILASNQAIMEAQRGIAFVKQFSTDFSAEVQGVGNTGFRPTEYARRTPYYDP